MTHHHPRALPLLSYYCGLRARHPILPRDTALRASVTEKRTRQAAIGIVGRRIGQWLGDPRSPSLELILQGQPYPDGRRRPKRDAVGQSSPVVSRAAAGIEQSRRVDNGLGRQS